MKSKLKAVLPTEQLIRVEFKTKDAHGSIFFATLLNWCLSDVVILSGMRHTRIAGQ